MTAFNPWMGPLMGNRRARDMTKRKVQVAVDFVHFHAPAGSLCGTPGAVVSQRELVTCPECLKALEAK